MKSGWKSDVKAISIGVGIFLVLEAALVVITLFFHTAQEKYPVVFSTLDLAMKIYIGVFFVYTFARGFTGM